MSDQTLYAIGAAGTGIGAAGAGTAKAITALKELIESQPAQKAFDNMFGGPTKELGIFGSVIIRNCSLFVDTIGIAANAKLRTLLLMAEATESVEESKRIPPNPTIAAEILDAAKYTEDGSPVRTMFRELLSRSINSVRQNEVHPAFSKIIEQLSRDEAIILHYMSINMPEVKALKHIGTTLFFDIRFASPLNINMETAGVLITHLIHLGLIESTDPTALQSNPFGQPVGVQFYMAPFGYAFAKACIPVEGFPVIETNNIFKQK